MAHEKFTLSENEARDDDRFVFFTAVELCTKSFYLLGRQLIRLNRPSKTCPASPTSDVTAERTCSRGAVRFESIWQRRQQQQKNNKTIPGHFHILHTALT